MRKNFFVYVVLSILAISLSGCGKKTDTSNQNTSNQPEASQEESFSGSLKDLINGGKTLKCTWQSSQDDSGQISGTIYIKGKKFKQDITFKNPETDEDSGVEIDFHSVSDGEWVYSWTSNTPGKGTKMNLSQFETQQEQSDSNTTMVDMTKENNYTCLPWSISDSEFVPPADVEFKDITQEMQGLQENAAADLEKAKETVCNMCDQAPDEETRMQCRQNAGCE
jgi:hypothetical protein